MKITVGTNTIKKMIEGYYKEVYNFSGKATIKVTSNDDYYGPSFNTQVLLTGKVKVLEEATATIDISLDEVKNSIVWAFNQEGLEAENIEFYSGTHYVTEGYGMSEHTFKEAYFKGAEVEVKGFQKKMGTK